MLTALSCLTLEVYYRYLPLFKEDAEGKDKTPARGRKRPAKTAPGEENGPVPAPEQGEGPPSGPLPAD